MRGAQYVDPVYFGIVGYADTYLHPIRAREYAQIFIALTAGELLAGLSERQQAFA